MELRAEPRGKLRAEPRAKPRAEPRGKLRAEPRPPAELRAERRAEPRGSGPRAKRRVELRAKRRVELRAEPGEKLLGVPRTSSSRVSAPGTLRDRGASRTDPQPRPPRAGAEATDAPRTKAAQREATTAALIKAARELFAEQGYAAVSTEEIVQRAGVTRGALYHHFRGGKEELFRAVLVQLSAEVTQRVTAAARAKDDPWDALVAGIDTFLDACATPEAQRIVLTDGPSVLGWDVWRAIDANYSHGLIEDALRRAQAAGRLLEQPTDALAHVLLGALHEAAMVVARADDPSEARNEMGRMVGRLLDGLRGPQAWETPGG